MKYITILAVILAVCLYFAINRLVVAKDKINSLESEKNNLINIVKGYQNAEVEANITIKQLRDKIRNNNQSNDWYNTPIPFELLDVVQKRHNRNKTN